MARFNTNICMFDGNLTRDPELKVFDSGARVVRFSLAVNEPSKNKEEKGDVQFVDFEAWDTAADILANLKKGDWLFVKSSYRREDWTDKDGNKRQSPRFRVNHFNADKFIPNKNNGVKAKKAEKKAADEPTTTAEPVAASKKDGDIPF